MFASASSLRSFVFFDLRTLDDARCHPFTSTFDHHKTSAHNRCDEFFVNDLSLGDASTSFMEIVVLHVNVF